VVDDVDGGLHVMPQAIRAAASRLSGSSIPAADKTAVQSLIDKLEQKAGIGEGATKKDTEGAEALSVVGKIKNLLLGKDQEIEMTSEELNEAVGKAVADATAPLAEAISVLAKSVEAPTEGAAATEGTEGAAATTTEAPAAPSVDDIAKAVEGILEPYVDVLDKALDRIAGIEKALAIRKSLDGQEGASSEAGEGTPTLQDAIAKAFTRPQLVAAA